MVRVNEENARLVALIVRENSRHQNIALRYQKQLPLPSIHRMTNSVTLAANILGIASLVVS